MIFSLAEQFTGNRRGYAVKGMTGAVLFIKTKKEKWSEDGKIYSATVLAV